MILTKKPVSMCWMPAAVFFIGLSSFVLLLWVGRMSERQRVNALLIDAVMGARISASTGHLWLEEAVSGDDTADEALGDIEKAVGLITVALHGGESGHGLIPGPLSDPEFRAPIEEIRSLMVKFGTLGRERLRDHRKGGVGTALDQQFDAVFKDIHGRSTLLEKLIERKSARALAQSRRIFYGIVTGWLFVVVVTTFGLLSQDRRRRDAEEALRAANERLLAQTEELEAHRGHLSELVGKRTAELSSANEVLRQRQRAIDSSTNGVLISDAASPDHAIVYVNPAFERITGYSAAEALGRNSRFLARDDRDQMGLEDIRRALREKREGRAVLRNYRKDGSLFWNELSVSPVHGEDGKVTHFVGVINDITEHRRYEAELERQANHDTLTGLPNRNLLADRLRQALSLSRRARLEAAVLFLNLDHFTLVNDGLGHAAGDRVLKLLSERLAECVRSSDTVARYAGDEFVIVLSEIEQGDYTATVAQRLQKAVSTPLSIDSNELVLSCSIGISQFPRDGEDEETLLKNADIAMHRAKELGRDAFRFYQAEMNEWITARMSMEGRLRRALENGEFSLHYQPQVDLKTGGITGAEALLRWQNKELGQVPPGRFIPLAEETGLIVPIGQWVLRSACSRARAWQDAGLELTLAINLSARQFWQGDLVDVVSGVMKDTGMDPTRLELELTESLVMRDAEQAASALRGLKGLGIQLSIDDFGTGYSSLSQLRRFPFEKLKIDISFVREIEHDEGSAAVAKTIIDMAHNLGLRVIAEGVETEGQLKFLRDHGCDEVQGFLFSKPLPADEFFRFAKEGRWL